MGNYDFELDLDTINTQSTIINWISPSSRVLEFGGGFISKEDFDYE